MDPQKLIYLDYNATTPVDDAVFESMEPFFRRQFANASSKTHFPGRMAAEAVEASRSKVAGLIGSEISEVIFTSGSTESINLAIQGSANTYRSKGNHLITWKTEHKAVLDTYLYLEKNGFRITFLDVDREGLPDLNALEENITDETILVSMMLANNETGVISPVREVSTICKSKNALLFCDATQAPGKMQIDVNELDVDLLSVSAHKMYGPKGVGALFIRRKNPRVTLTPMMYGGGHENGLRSGTYNVSGIVGMGKAAELCVENYWDDTSKMSKHRTIIEQALTDSGMCFINGNMKNRLPNTTNICFEGIKSTELITKLSNVCVATGSACTSALQEPSHVLKAMSLTESQARSSIRISTGRYTTTEEVIQASNMIVQTIKNLQ